MMEPSGAQGSAAEAAAIAGTTTAMSPHQAAVWTSKLGFQPLNACLWIHQQPQHQEDGACLNSKFNISYKCISLAVIIQDSSCQEVLKMELLDVQPLQYMEEKFIEGRNVG